MRMLLAIIFVLSPPVAGATSTLGSPDALYSSTNLYSLARWYFLGLYERGAVVGYRNTHDTWVSYTPDIEETYQVVAGYTTSVVTVTGRVGFVTGQVFQVTNRYPYVVSEIRTNQLLYGSWVSTNSNPETGDVVTTNYPTVSVSLLQDLDTHLRWIISRYYATNELPEGAADWIGTDDGAGGRDYTLPRLSWEKVYDQVGGGLLLVDSSNLVQWDWSSYLMSTNAWRERFAVLDLLTMAPAPDPMMVVTQRSWHIVGDQKVLSPDTTQEVAYATFSINVEADHLREHTHEWGHYHWTPELGTCTRVDFDKDAGYGDPTPNGSASVPQVGRVVWSNEFGGDTNLVMHIIESDPEMRFYQWYDGDGDSNNVTFTGSNPTNVTASALSGGGDSSFCESSYFTGIERGSYSTNLWYDHTNWVSSTSRLYSGTATVSFDTNTYASGSGSYGRPSELTVPSTFDFWGAYMNSFHTLDDSARAQDSVDDITVEVDITIDADRRGYYDVFSTTLKMHSEGIIDWTDSFAVWSTNELTNIP